MIFISSDDRIAYYHAPKSGSRTMLGYLSLVKEPDLYEKFPQYFHQTDDEVYSPLRERVKRLGKHHYTDCQIPVVENEFRIAIKRDPVKRFISGYTNRVLHHKKLGSNPPDIHEFIANFDSIRSKVADIETHFRPQVEFLGKSQEIFTHIFDVTELKGVRTLFEEIYQREFPDLHLQQGGNRNKITLSSKEESWVKEKYELDYAFGWC